MRDQVRVLDRAHPVADPVAHRARRGTTDTLSAPRSSPPCGADNRAGPRRRCRSALAKRQRLSAPLVVRQARNPTTPRPAYCAASRASVRASSGWRVRLAAITTATSTPGRSVASRAASSTRSVKAVMPPKVAAYPLGSTWISSQRDPSARLVLGGLEHQPAYGVLGAQHRRGRCRTAAGSGTSPSRRPPTTAGGQSARQRLGQPDALLARRARARSRCRIDPVKCRWRCAFGKVVSERPRSPSRSRGQASSFWIAVDALGQVVVAEGVRQPQVAGRAERLAGHDRDLGLVEDDLGELGRTCRRHGRRCRAPARP